MYITNQETRYLTPWNYMAIIQDIIWMESAGPAVSAISSPDKVFVSVRYGPILRRHVWCGVVRRHPEGNWQSSELEPLVGWQKIVGWKAVECPGYLRGFLRLHFLRSGCKPLHLITCFKDKAPRKRGLSASLLGIIRFQNYSYQVCIRSRVWCLKDLVPGNLDE